MDVQPAWKVVGEDGTIDAEGTFTAAQLGSGVVIATYADLTAGAQLTVVPGAVAQLELTPEEATLVAGINFRSRPLTRSALLWRCGRRGP